MFCEALVSCPFSKPCSLCGCCSLHLQLPLLSSPQPGCPFFLPFSQRKIFLGKGQMLRSLGESTSGFWDRNSTVAFGACWEESLACDLSLNFFGLSWSCLALLKCVGLKGLWEAEVSWVCFPMALICLGCPIKTTYLIEIQANLH